MALRIVQNGHIQLSNVFVAASKKLATSSFADGPNMILEDSRFIVPWISVGMMAGIYETSVEYIHHRV